MKTTLAIIGIILAMLVVWALTSSGRNDVNTENPIVATMYKTPTCGCCQVYGQYLKRENVKLTVVDMDDISPIKEQHGISRNLESCHTTMIGGYVVEGHMPMGVIEKLLTEKPDIKGIALPGMPSGSPGMPGPKTGEWTIYALGNDGMITEFMKY
ncbi:MAG: DUF411 domain-containing protein [Parcubacteria group bacterium]